MGNDKAKGQKGEAVCGLCDGSSGKKVNVEIFLQSSSFCSCSIKNGFLPQPFAPEVVGGAAVDAEVVIIVVVDDEVAIDKGG